MIEGQERFHGDKVKVLSLIIDLIVRIFTTMIWNIIRFIMAFGMDTFYKRTAVKNLQYVTVKGPVILAINHPNAFMDPAMFSFLAYPPRFYFLARGDVFKPGISSFIFEGLGIAPIFRIQDGGREGLKKNDETYRRVFAMLRENKKVIIFAEGLCVQERRLRPLKKGVPRMIFNAMEEIDHPELTVVPVGVVYTDPKKFRSHLFYNIGEPIKVADFMEEYKAQPARTMNAFIRVLEPKMKELIVHIDNPANDKLVGWLEELFLRDLCKQQNLKYKDLDHELKIAQQITAIVNKADVENNDALQFLKQKCEIYSSDLDKMGIRDWLINPNNQSKVNWLNFIGRKILLVIFAPFWIRGLIGNYPPYKLSEKIVNKKIKNVEFHSSFNMAIGTLLMWVYYGLQFYIVNKLAGFGWACLAVFISFVTGKFVLYYYPFLKKAMGLFRVLTHPQRVVELKKQRAEIEELFAGLNKN
jgi:glycerol-3-phosphate O-acyltransferase/dihydroxyacetone phosphate acyltransferase